MRDNQIDIILTPDPQKTKFATGIITIERVENGIWHYKNPHILLNETLPDGNLLQALPHEAQHIRHHLVQAGNPDFRHNDNDHCLLRRIQEADAQTESVWLAYLLKQAGDPEPWQATLQTVFAPMSEAFEKTCHDRPLSLYTGVARRAAFDTWFTIPHNRAFYDENTLTVQHNYVEHAAKANPAHGLNKTSLSAHMIDRIGKLSGINYLALKRYPAITDDFYRQDIAANIEKLNRAARRYDKGHTPPGHA